MTQLVGGERKFQDGAALAFEKDKRELLARLTAVKAMALAQKATINWTAYWDDVMEYLEEEAPKNWREIFRKLIRGVVTDHAEQWSVTLGLTWSAQNLFARDWYNNYILKFAQDIIETTKQDISAVLSFGMREGWGIPQIEDSLETLFQQYISGDANLNTWFTDRLPRYRTEMIARTETIRASNAGTTALYQEWGVAQHEWQDQPAQPLPQESQPLPASNYTPPAPATGPGQSWLVMLYQDADDQILEKDIYVELNEAERVGSSDRVKIVAQIDRFRGAYQGR